MTALSTPAVIVRPVDPELRGTTTFAARAVRRLAAQAATEVEDVVAGVKAEATVDSDRTALRLRLPLAYPAPIRLRARQVRSHLLRRVTELTGLTVSRVDIDIAVPVRNRTGRRVQ